MLSGELELDRLQQLSDEEVMAELVAVKGIGEWSAHIFLMFTLGRPDVLAVGDLGIRRAVERAYGLPELPAAAEVDRARRAVAPAPHGGLPAAVALAGQRADVGVLRVIRLALAAMRGATASIEGSGAAAVGRVRLSDRWWPNCVGYGVGNSPLVT